MKNAKLYALVGVLTLGNIGFRVANTEEGRTARLVSHLEPGDRVESVELDRLVDGFGAEAACRMVVAFNPDCPFCRAASQRERHTAREGPWGETLWITDQERPRLGAFVAGLSEASRHAVAPGAFEALDVDAVPALFLIDAGGTVRWVGPYRGDETGDVLAGRCDGTAPSSGPTLATGGVTAVSGPCPVSRAGARPRAPDRTPAVGSRAGRARRRPARGPQRGIPREASRHGRPVPIVPP